MPLVAGLNPSIRLQDDRPKLPRSDNDDSVQVEVVDGEQSEDAADTNDAGEVLRIHHADGQVTVSTDGSPVQNRMDLNRQNPPRWFDNLVDRIDTMQLQMISENLLVGVADDIQSRQEWIDERAEGIKMLALSAKADTGGEGAEAASFEGTSKVRHPMMKEAVLRFQANALGEMLPASGPVKVEDDDNNGDLPRDQLADAFQKDFNHFLTTTASEYYPDTDRMYLGLGFSGAGIKKIHFCPLRNRPVSETVDADDLIVNNNATSLDTAKRKTHRVFMSPGLVKRMQILGIYVDIDLSTPNMPQYDALQLQKKDQQGIAIVSMRPEDRDREIFEVYCELDIKGFEHTWKGKVTSLEVPYRVTIDVSTRRILAIVRNYDKEADVLPVARNPFVMYVFVPGFGFWPIGLLHIMSDMTLAATAAWRIMLDNGMFANFPGFLIAKSATRQQTMVLRVAPGSGAQVDTGGQKINDAVMALPYKTEGMAALMTLEKDIVEQGQRVGMTSEVPSGEGRDDVPVGTMLATIEQAQKILNSVHRRMHQAQALEFQKIAQCFREHPESWWQCKHKSAYPWDEETFQRALADCNLVPKADPNTANHMQRLMKVGVLKALAKNNPTMYDPIAIDTAVIEAIGYTNPQRFFAPPAAQAKPPPEIQAKQAELQIKDVLAKAAMITAQSKAQKDQHEMGLGAAKLQLQQQNDDVKNKLAVVGKQIDTGIAMSEIDQKSDAELANERVQLVDLAQNIAVHPESAHLIAPLVQPAFQHVVKRTAEAEQKRKSSAPGLGGAEGLV